MPAVYCPRCHRANPEGAYYCYHDGLELRAPAGGVGHRFPQEFSFPSGRSCRSFEDLAQACQEEWVAARHFLKQGVFRDFFASIGRQDLVRTIEETKSQANADLALTAFLQALPTTVLTQPKLDIQPRRLFVGSMQPGETRRLQLIVQNKGKGCLQGTMTLSEGCTWVKFVDAAGSQVAIQAPREQRIVLQIDTRGLEAAQSYGAVLLVATNGGVVEVPIRMDVVAQPFSQAPFQGVRTPRELAERMRSHAKAAGPVLESGQVQRWFEVNGWKFPVQGAIARGVGGVQQFFEAMGLSRPPQVQLSQREIRLKCTYPETVRFQVALQTPAKKWVYGQIFSSAPWLRVLTPHVAGPQQTTISFEADPKLMPRGRIEEQVRVQANGGKNLVLQVQVDVKGMPGSKISSGRLLQPIALLAFLLAFVRLLIGLAVDGPVRSPAILQAAGKLEIKVSPESPLLRSGGWLELPWASLVLGDASLAWKTFDPDRAGDFEPRLAEEFRYYWLQYFLRNLIGWTAWLGPLLIGLLVVRLGGWTNLPWGLLAGCGLGLLGSAGLGCVLLCLDFPAYLIAHGWSGPTGWLGWLVVVVFFWAGWGTVLGVILTLVPPLRNWVLAPVHTIGNLFAK